MRSKEQFKAYVYEKADAAAAKRRKSRAMAFRSAAAFSLLVIVGGVYLYTGIGKDSVTTNDAAEAEIAYLYAADGGALADFAAIEESFNSSVTAYAADDMAGSVATESKSTSQKAETFKYDETVTEYSQSIAGVVRGGFSNTVAVAITGEEEAKAHAENECTVEYDTVTAAYDSKNDVWKVVFCMSNTAGGSQEVYFGSDGITDLIVYTE